MIDVTNAQIRRPSELVKSGNKEMIKNMIKKVQIDQYFITYALV